MAHDPDLERRLAEMLAGLGAKAEPKRMFGGVAFMVGGHMCVGITNKSHLMVRFDPERHAEIAEWNGALPMTYGKGEMKGFLFVDPAAIAERKGLERWVKLALAHARTLPPKSIDKAARKAGKKASLGPSVRNKSVGSHKVVARPASDVKRPKR